MTTPANLARRFAAAATTAAAALGLLASPLSAQLETVDPDEALQYPIDGDLEEAPGGQSVYAEPQPAAPATTYSPAPESAPDPAIAVEPTVAPTWSDPTQPGAAVDNTYAGNNYDGSSAASDTAIPPVVANAEQTYREDDLIGAAQGVFGDGAKEVATLIQPAAGRSGRAQCLYRRTRGGRRLHRGRALWFGHALSQGRGRTPGLLDRTFDRFRRGRQRREHLRAGLQSLRQRGTVRALSRGRRPALCGRGADRQLTCARATWC